MNLESLLKGDPNEKKYAIANPELEDLFKSYVKSQSESTSEKSRNYESMLSDLKFRRELMESPRDFEEGDIVVWKDSLKNKSFPQYGQPAIVLNILEEPFFNDKQTPENHIFKEPHDLLLGIIMDNNEYLTLYFDSRRFKNINPNN